MEAVGRRVVHGRVGAEAEVGQDEQLAALRVVARVCQRAACVGPPGEKAMSEAPGAAMM